MGYLNRDRFKDRVIEINGLSKEIERLTEKVELNERNRRTDRKRTE